MSSERRGEKKEKRACAHLINSRQWPHAQQREFQKLVGAVISRWLGWTQRQMHVICVSWRDNQRGENGSDGREGTMW